MWWEPRPAHTNYDAVSPLVPAAPCGMGLLSLHTDGGKTSASVGWIMKGLLTASEVTGHRQCHTGL